MKELLDKILAYNGKTITIMEVCGTHTMQIARMGLKSLLPNSIKITSGPGCPVCVTSIDYFDRAIGLAAMQDVIIVTFGDLVRVPGSRGNLQDSSGDVRIVYSPLQALEIAAQNADKTVVFLAVGFETTIPAIANMLIEANERRIPNLYVLPQLKTMPDVLGHLLKNSSDIDGFLYPGHVAAITGTEPFNKISRQHGIPGIIAGFTDKEILLSIACLIEMIKEQKCCARNLYPHIVREEGNTIAKAWINEMFALRDSEWRGFGKIHNSGLTLKGKWQDYDIENKIGKDFASDISNTKEKLNLSCRCGEILNGSIEPAECPLYGKACTPQRPAGACMVSSEGACAAYYRYSYK